MFFNVVLLAQLQDMKQGPGGCLDDLGVATFKCLEVVYSNLLFIAGGFVGLALFAMFVYGAYLYITSFGSPEKIKKAQAAIRYAIVGVILFVSSYLILFIIDYLFLGGKGKIFELNLGP